MVTDVVPILPQHTVTTDGPFGGEVRWFSAQAQQGDSMLFRTSNACRLQLFSPTGEKLLAADTDAGRGFYGIEATDAGNYLLALSDVQGSDLYMSVTYHVPGKPAIGDLNADGQISVNDVTSMVSVILGVGSNSVDKWNADLNGDGEIDVSDIMMLVSIILGG